MWLLQVTISNFQAHKALGLQCVCLTLFLIGITMWVTGWPWSHHKMVSLLPRHLGKGVFPWSRTCVPWSSISYMGGQPVQLLMVFIFLVHVKILFLNLDPLFPLLHMLHSPSAIIHCFIVYSNITPNVAMHLLAAISKKRNIYVCVYMFYIYKYICMYIWICVCVCIKLLFVVFVPQPSEDPKNSSIRI